jgi:hypothetical protein
MKRYLSLLCASIAFCNLAVAQDVNLPPNLSSKFKITTRRMDDEVRVQVEKDRTLFSVKGQSGISNADIERLGARWPDTVTLRLHLKGLESFRASNGQVTLDATVSTDEGKPTVRLWKGGNENSELDKKSPLWMDVRILAGDGKLAEAIPSKDGYFEMTLPKAFFAGNPKSITLRWIDYYR